jgi:uncharacterized membrane protein
MKERLIDFSHNIASHLFILLKINFFFCARCTGNYSDRIVSSSLVEKVDRMRQSDLIVLLLIPIESDLYACGQIYVTG